MIVKQVRLSFQAKHQLARLKYKTGIMNWNILSRWALCASLSEPSVPQDVETQKDNTSNVEMNWQVFGGDYQEVYDALIRQRCIDDGLGTDPETLAKYFYLHLNRGIAYLANGPKVNSLTDMLSLALPDKDNTESDEEQ